MKKILRYYQQAQRKWAKFTNLLEQDTTTKGIFLILKQSKDEVANCMSLCLDRNIDLQSKEKIVEQHEKINSETSTIQSPACTNLLSSDDLDKKEAQLLTETKFFFKPTLTAAWKKYPQNKLTGVYQGHLVCYFTMPAHTHNKANRFVEHLKERGYSVELKKVGARPSIVVDLSASSLKNLSIFSNSNTLFAAKESTITIYSSNEKLKAAAAKGDAEAQYHLGGRYKHGYYGLQQNYVLAVEYYLAAAKQGHIEAQHNLAVCYENGEGTKQNLPEAVRWYLAAAKQAHSFAQHNLALCYSNGYGILQDEKEATRWFHAAAKQGIAPSQYNLAVAYYQGEGIGKNEQKAKKWCMRAANQGHEKAMMMLNVVWQIAPQKSILRF